MPKLWTALGLGGDRIPGPSAQRTVAGSAVGPTFAERDYESLGALLRATSAGRWRPPTHDGGPESDRSGPSACEAHITASRGLTAMALLLGDLPPRHRYRSSIRLTTGRRCETRAAPGGYWWMGEWSGRPRITALCSCRPHRGGGRVLTLPRRRQVATPSGPSRRSLRSLRVSLQGYRIFRLCCPEPGRPEGPYGTRAAQRLETSLPPGLPAVAWPAPAPPDNNQHRKAQHHGNRKHRHHCRQPHP